ncbi:MAG: hypothetical protein IPN94_19260 [Sphingobacteriales bacterium]|nr:hypothetical protein [Sphingobacteriales bacterium]
MSKYQYNPKELNSDFGLLWSDCGARRLDLQRGVWGQIDPLAEKYYGWSGYNYVAGNPIRLIDPDGPATLGIVDGVLDLTGKKDDFINYIDDTQFGQDMNKAGSGIRQTFNESADGLYKMITGEGDEK